MWFLELLLFAIVFAIISMCSFFLGITNFYFYLVLSLFMMFIQYMLGPKIVEWSARVRYVTAAEFPSLHKIVEELSQKAGIPKPRVGISEINIPNAFAFGRTVKDGRVCLTRGIMQLLDEGEVKAVLGHEMSHLKNRDVLTITLLSVVPIILYRIAWQFMFFGSGRRERSNNTALVGLVAFIFYFITQLLVMYASRIREYFADRGSVALGNPPNLLASALVKLVYGSARMNKDSLKEVEGLKAFFLNNPSRATNEIRELSQLRLNKDAGLDPEALSSLAARKINLSFGEKFSELFSTHPNMLKRIKKLSSYQG
jgi:heat shock protein HtpX